MVKAEPSNTVCRYPWRELSLKSYDNSGQATTANPCCVMERPHTTPLNVACDSKTPLEILEDFEPLRNAMLNGEQHPACQYCWDLERDGVKSPRLKSGDAFDETLIELHTVDLLSSSVCNLRCRMCKSGSSSSILLIDQPVAQRLNLMHLDAYKEGEVVTDGSARAANVQWQWIQDHGIPQIKVSGGEPLMDKGFIAFLENLVNKETTVLDFHTNGTKFTPHNLDLLHEFKLVVPNISIDGTDKVFEYTRHPARWDKVSDRINYLSYHLFNMRKLKFNVVVSAMNVLNLADIIAWCHTLNPNIKLMISWDLVYPIDRGMAISHLPVYLLEETKARLKPLVKTYNPKFALAALSIVQSAIDNNAENKSKLKTELIQFDQIKNQSYKDYLDPWLIEYLDSPNANS